MQPPSKFMLWHIQSALLFLTYHTAGPTSNLTFLDIISRKNANSNRPGQSPPQKKQKKKEENTLELAATIHWHFIPARCHNWECFCLMSISRCAESNLIWVISAKLICSTYIFFCNSQILFDRLFWTSILQPTFGQFAIFWQVGVNLTALLYYLRVS